MQAWPECPIPPVPGSIDGPALRLFDTADRAVRPVGPGPTATMYVCGITPYDATHLGHAATYLTFDLINRQLRAAGHDVHYVQNVTDVDDPLFERATRDGVDWIALGLRETELFRTDMAALRVLPPRHYVGAVESIDEAIDFIDRLLVSGAAYVIDDLEYPDVYFSHDATKVFGYESGFDAEVMVKLAAERGGDPQRAWKRHPLDPVLWRLTRPGEPSWSAPFGAGRPGWHIECAAIAMNRLGFGFDIQGGGSDLVFPHHEFSAAHGEALHGASSHERFARHYVHAAMIGLDGDKMSKSLGNLVLVSRLREQGVDPMAVRLALISEHYRLDRSWSTPLLEAAQSRLDRWRRAVVAQSGPSVAETIARVRAHLCDDLNTPKAIDAIDGWVYNAIEYGGDDATAPLALAHAVDALLGVDLLRNQR